MKRISLSVLLAFCWLSFSTGCLNKTSATLMPGSDLTKIKSFYIVQREDDNDKGSTHSLIKENLEKRGYSVVGTGLQNKLPYNSDAVIVYDDKWMWDITMYMLALTINIKDPSNGAPIATASSVHGSLTRKAPNEMVDEVLENILNAKPDINKVIY